MNNSKKNLIICPVGDNSYHKQWLSSSGRNFDLMLIYFGETPEKYKGDSDYYFQIQGLFKLESIFAAINTSINTIKKYDAIFLPDDDLSLGSKEIDSLFKIFYEYNLDLAQPAVSGGKINHLITKQDKNCFLRYVNFVEMMGPIFKTSILLSILPTFVLNRSGWGIDFMWSKNLKDKKIAIIDAVGVIHGVNRPHFQGEYYKRLKELGIDPFKELSLISNKHDCDFNIPGKMVEYDRILI